MNEQLDRLEAKIVSLESKVDASYQSVEKLRKYFKWTLIITVGAILIPLLILPAVLPAFLASQMGSLPTSF